MRSSGHECILRVVVDVSAGMRCLRFLGGVLFLTLGSCGAEESSHQLRVDLVTDFLPGSEFDAVRVSIGDGDIRENVDHVVDPSRDYVRGVALGDIRVQATEQAIEVDLFQDGVLIIARQVSVIVQSAVTIATVVITRDCRGVMCPGAGDNPLLASCLGGQCADPRCTVETPEFCPVGTCFAAADCAAHACAQTTCLTGACLYSPDDGVCAPGQRCDLDQDCVDGEFDAGTPDVGPPDAGMSDVRFPDVSSPDVPVPDAGPDIPDVPTPDVFDAGPAPGCMGPDPDTLFLYDFLSFSDLVSRHLGSARDGAGSMNGDSPCGQVLITPGPLESRFVVPDQASFHVAEGSLDFWARRPAASGDTVGVVSRDEMSITTEGQLTLFFSQDERFVLRGQVNNSVSVLLCSSDPIPLEEWMRIGINWGPGGLELYLDGMLQTGGGTVRIFDAVDATCSSSTIPFSIAATQDPFVLGASSHLSDTESDEPAAFPGPGWQYDHFRLSRVRRDYAMEL
ncbi:MAG: hypothetical protein ACI9KE_003227 [Polyangiales bacterium]|jgi:hypothetical protein